MNEKAKKLYSINYLRLSLNLLRKNLFKLTIAEANSLSLERDVIMPLVAHHQVHLYQIDNHQKDSFWFQIKNAA